MDADISVLAAKRRGKATSAKRGVLASPKTGKTERGDFVSRDEVKGATRSKDVDPRIYDHFQFSGALAFVCLPWLTSLVQWA